MKNIYKRIIDVTISLVVLIVLSPIFFIVIFFSIVSQGFPIFFKQERLGINGNYFNAVKFRTMINGPSKGAKDDEKRITSWGRILRKTSIDEIPLFLNVIKGEMSVVGPRPMPIKYLNRFNNHQIKRMLVKPGITGLAQINGRNKLTWNKKFNLDVEYVKNNNLLLDFKIIFKTIIIVIKSEGVVGDNYEIMPEFLGNENNDD